ncbi:hypothetical protein RJZ57_000741 [Blastomyces gilchristii]
MANRQQGESAREQAIQDSSPVSKRPTGDIRPTNIYAASASKSYLSSGKQITRFRISKSCLVCRRRKVKCDTVRPTCGTCEKTKSECVYSSSSLTDSSQSRHHSRENKHGIKRQRELNEPVNIDDSSIEVLSPYHILKEIQRGQAALREQYSDSQAIAARLDQLTAIVEQWARTNDPQSLEELSTTRHRQRHDAPTNAGLQQQGAPDLPSQLSDTSPPVGPLSKTRLCQIAQAENNTGDDFPIPSGLETDLVDPVGSLNLGHLSLEEGGKPRYVGTTYWAYISREITELNQLLRGQTLSVDRSPSPDDAYSSLDENDFADSALLSSSRGAKTSLPTRKDSFNKSVLFPLSESPGSPDKSVEPYMLENVPTKRQSRILLKGFMSGVHAISPVVHPPSILRKYKAFWNWYENSKESAESCPDPSFIPLLYAIWYGGSVTISRWIIRDEFDIESRAVLSTRFHDEVTRWLRKISFPRNPSIHGLKAFLLVQTILSREEEPLASSLFISLALRVAQTMGLHRDPAQFGISACQAEARRRIWWHIVHMDGVVAMSSGLPPLVSDENYWDVRITSEVKDTLLDSPEAAEYERMVNNNERKPDCPSDPNICGGSSMVNVYYLSAKGKYVMAQAIRKILKIQLGTKPVTRRDMESLRTILIDLQSKLQAIVDRIPVSKCANPGSRDGHSYHSTPSCTSSTAMDSGDSTTAEVGPSCLEQYHSPVLVAFHKWARILLSLFVDKVVAIRHCHGFMEKFILLATDSDFQPFQWSWPGNHQPMHATMYVTKLPPTHVFVPFILIPVGRIMLIDLYERPQTAEAPKSRAFIDKIFSLSGPDGGVVGGEDGISTSRPLRDGGREAWDMLRRLREKAWLKAGLDPSVLWTEQAQAEARRPSNRHMSTDAPRERRESSVQSFTDSYYTLIKEPYDHNVHSNSQSTKWQRERERARAQSGKDNAYIIDKTAQESHSHTQLEGIGVSSQEYATTTLPQSDTPLPWLRTSQSPQTDDIAKQPWATASPFPRAPINDGPIYQFSTSTTTTTHTTKPPGPFNIPTSSTNYSASSYSNDPLNVPTFTSSHTPTALDLPMPLPIPTASDIDIDIDIQPKPGPYPNPTFQSASPSSSPILDPHNLQFDWDQWDAVFGPSLPVVDDLMHLDSINTGGAGTGTGPGGNGRIGITADGGDGPAVSKDETDTVLRDLGLAADYYDGHGS